MQEQDVWCGMGRASGVYVDLADAGCERGAIEQTVAIVQAHGSLFRLHATRNQKKFLTTKNSKFKKFFG